MDIKHIINNLPLDKIAHFGMGAVIAAALLPFGWNIAVVWLLLAATGKEVIDSMMGKELDKLDWLVTVAGGAAMLGWLLHVAPLIMRIT